MFGAMWKLHEKHILTICIVAYGEANAFCFVELMAHSLSEITKRLELMSNLSKVVSHQFQKLMLKNFISKPSPASQCHYTQCLMIRPVPNVLE